MVNSWCHLFRRSAASGRARRRSEFSHYYGVRMARESTNFIKLFKSFDVTEGRTRRSDDDPSAPQGKTAAAIGRRAARSVDARHKQKRPTRRSALVQHAPL